MKNVFSQFTAHSVYQRMLEVRMDKIVSNVERLLKSVHKA